MRKISPFTALKFRILKIHNYIKARENVDKSRHCGSFLWVYDPTYPELMHPFASAIDTDLPKPPEHTHIMLEFAASWMEVPDTPSDRAPPTLSR